MAWPLKKEEKPLAEVNGIEVKPGEESKPVEDKKDVDVAALIAGALKPITDKLNEFDSKFTEMGDKFVSRPAAAAVDADGKKPEKVSIFDNEDLGIAQRLAPLAVETLNTRYELNYDRAVRAISEEIGIDAWKQIEPEVRESLDKTDNPMLRSNPIYISNTIDMIVGKKLRSGVRFDSSGKRFFLEDASHADARKAQVDAEAGLAQAPKTRARQLKAMKSFGMTPEEYKKALGELEVVSDV